jgi:hypothetical protein
VALACVLIVAWLGWAAIGRFRKGLLTGAERGRSTWTLEDLREMRDSGQITEQEYQALRLQVIGGSPGAQGNPQSNCPGSPNDKMSR